VRVLITVPSVEREFGGPTDKARRLSAELRRLGDDVVVAGVGVSIDERTLGLPPLGRFHGTPVPRAMRSLRAMATTADVVHVMGYRDPVGTTAALTAMRTRVPYVLEPVGMHRRRLRSERLKWLFERGIGARVVDRAARVVATSGLEATELIEDGAPAERIVRRPNGVSVDSLLPLPERGALRAEYEIPHGAPLVLSLSRITMKKGLPDLVRAIEGIEDMHVLIVGPSELDGTLQEIHRLSRGFTDRVHVVPEGVWGQDRRRLFAEADVFCLPSATENFGTAAAEAASLGLPVVLSDRCGVAEWLPEGSRAIVPYGDIDALRRALAALDTPDVRARAQEGAARLRSSLSWGGLAADQHRIYETVTGETVATTR
jgi:glycosyltransferase involved in cell wall biosynthesis